MVPRFPYSDVCTSQTMQCNSKAVVLLTTYILLTLDFQSFIVIIGRIVHIETQSEKHYRSDASYIKFWGGQFLLKPLDTIGNCQRPVFPLAVSQHMHIITNL